MKRQVRWVAIFVVMISIPYTSFHTEAVFAEEAAAERSIEDRLKALEEDDEFVKEEFLAHVEKMEQKIPINFYVTMEFEDFNNKDSALDAHDVGFFTSAQLNKRLKGFVGIEFERTAITKAGNRQGNVEVKQGWLEYSVNNHLHLRFGVVLVPFGRFNLVYFEPLQDLTDRPIVMRRVIPVSWSEAAVGIPGQAALDSDGASFFSTVVLNYQLYVVNGLTNELKDTSIRNARGSFEEDNNSKALVGRVGFVPYPEQEIGLSRYSGKYDTDHNQMTGYDVDWRFSIAPFELIGEHAVIKLDGAGFQRGSTTDTVPGQFQGLFAQLNYRFWFEALNDTVLGKDFPNPSFGIALRYGEATIDDDNDGNVGDNHERRKTAGLNYRPSDSWVFKVEYQWNDTDNERLEHGDNDGFTASVSAVF